MLAKAAGKSYIPVSQPTLMENKEFGYRVVVDYDPRYVNSIALCLQGEMEGLYQTGLYKKNPSNVIEYRITLRTEYDNVQPFVDHMNTLNDLYENFNIIVTYNENQLTEKITTDSKKKKSILGNLFKKK
ncbi:MAG: hypothetical protein IKT45_01180 [Lachnospiraceae bacterium]|nr:hypothetical protein [Lachnospiraceae bacterium]